MSFGGTGNWIDRIVSQGRTPNTFELIARFLETEKRLARRVAIAMEHQMANIIRREFYDEFMEFVESEKVVSSLNPESDGSEGSE